MLGSFGIESVLPRTFQQQLNVEDGRRWHPRVGVPIAAISAVSATGLRKVGMAGRQQGQQRRQDHLQIAVSTAPLVALPIMQGKELPDSPSRLTRGAQSANADVGGIRGGDAAEETDDAGSDRGAVGRLPRRFAVQPRCQ